jgi:hypothetical protein
MEKLLNAVIVNQRQAATRAIEELALTEEGLAEAGGGIAWPVVVVVLRYATDAY